MCWNYIENQKLVSIPELLGGSYVVREMLSTSGKNSFKPNYCIILFTKHNNGINN